MNFSGSRRERLLEFGALPVALLALRWLGIEIPWMLAAAGAAALALGPRPGPGTPWRLRHLIGRAAVQAGACAAGWLAVHFLSGPVALRPLALVPAWIVVTALVRLAEAPAVRERWLPGILAAWHRRVSPRAAGFLRVLLVAGFGLWLTAGFAAAIPLGSAESNWYATTMADVLTQVRAGVFPVFVGQSEYQFNGAIFPVRVAPLLHHLGIAADFATFRALPFAAVQNLVLIVIGIAAAVSAYAALAAVSPERRNLCAALACLYLACPGVLGLLYNTDLYMSWATVPFVPLVLAGSVLSFREGGFRPLALLACGLGFLWWGHAPIALWTTLLAGAIQAVRLWRERRNPASWSRAAAAGALLLLLAAYPVVSVLLFSPAAGSATNYTATQYGTIVALIRETFPAALLPVSADGGRLSDYQLGWSLWIALALAAGGALSSRRPEAIALAACAAAVLLLLLPVPVLNNALWSVVPAFIRDPTGNWAMNRLYLILAGLIVFAVAAVADQSRRAPLLLALALLWSGAEAANFRSGLKSRRIGLAALADPVRLENTTLTRYSYLMFPRPPAAFSHGVVDPLLESRLLGGDGKLLAGNAAAVAAGGEGVRTLGEGALTARSPDDTGETVLQPSFRLEPGRRQALVLQFGTPAPKGVLRVAGPSLHRVYALPEYGEPAAFGANPGASPVLPLFTSGREPAEAGLRFLPEGPRALEAGLTFARYRWVEYNPSLLPVAVSSWIPYIAAVRSPADAILETPRMHQRGYAATVDGRPATVVRTDNGLTGVLVPPGRHEVRLEYKAPFALALSYWISLTSLVLAAIGLVWGSHKNPQKVTKSQN